MRTEIEFRDGKRLVPDHLAVLMAMFDTTEYTYEEAIKIANDALLSTQLQRIERDIIRKHFSERH